MSLSTQYSTGTFTRRIAAVKSQSIVEIRFSGQEIGEVVAVYPQVSYTSCEVASGRVTYNGRLVCTLVYADESGKLCRIQKGAEFSHFADDDRFAPAQRGLCSLSCDRAQLKRDGSSFLVGVVVSADVSVFASAERSWLTSADGAICQSENIKLYSAVTFTGESEVEDDFDCVAEDVLIPAAEALVTDCNRRAGLVEISGEIVLSLLAVRDSKPVSLDRIIPFKAEIPCEEALLAGKAFCRAEVREINVTANVNEEKGSCGVELVARLGFSGLYYEEEEIPLITDAFSCSHRLELTFAEESAAPCSEIRVFTERIGGLCATKAKLDFSCAFLAAALPKAEFFRTESGIEGSLSATLLYEQNGEIRATEINLPFAVNLSGLHSDVGNVSVAVCGLNLRQRSEGECEAEAVLKISAADGENCSARYLTEMTERDPLVVNDRALSVYIPSAGDSLWATAKRLLRTPEDIQSTNPELTFPLTGRERILVFRSKTGETKTC